VRSRDGRGVEERERETENRGREGREQEGREVGTGPPIG